ncbi:hypothetical protein KKF61_04870 [Patescibacteria group bacterium]|nr:hypothetical protein [Patescibacteria group bacterium]MBU0964354.1 hypothetical protein [Patescibacteria group bacterium]
MRSIITSQSGYIALIAVIIITVVTLSIGLSLNILSIGETQAGLSVQQSGQSFGIADSCMQEAYLRLKQDSSYAGGNLNIGEGSCRITVTGALLRRTITVESDVNNVIKRLESDIRITLSGDIRILSWQELN